MDFIVADNILKKIIANYNTYFSFFNVLCERFFFDN